MIFPGRKVMEYLPLRDDQWERVLVRIFEAIADVPDLEDLMIDGSIVRVHQPGAGKKAGTGIFIRLSGLRVRNRSLIPASAFFLVTTCYIGLQVR